MLGWIGDLWEYSKEQEKEEYARLNGEKQDADAASPADAEKQSRPSEKPSVEARVVSKHPAAFFVVGLMLVFAGALAQVYWLTGWPSQLGTVDSRWGIARQGDLYLFIGALLLAHVWSQRSTASGKRAAKNEAKPHASVIEEHRPVSVVRLVGSVLYVASVVLFALSFLSFMSGFVPDAVFPDEEVERFVRSAWWYGTVAGAFLLWLSEKL